MQGRRWEAPAAVPAIDGSVLERLPGDVDAEGAERRRNFPTAPRPFDTCCVYLPLQRPKFIAPPSPNEVLEPSSPTGMLMLGFTLNREWNTNPVPSVSRP